MNVKAEALDQHKVQLIIDVPAEVVVKGFKQAVARIANQVKIPGSVKARRPAALSRCISAKKLLPEKRRILLSTRL